MTPLSGRNTPRLTFGILTAASIALVTGVLAWQGAGRIESSAVAARIDSLISQEYPAGEPGAAVLVSKGGTVILKKGFGLADTARKVPVTTATVFRLASVTKMFTGTAILMLSEKDKLVLDDAVAKILSASPPAWQKITVKHLLSHTAGLANYLDRPDSMAWARSEHTPSDLIDTFKDRGAAFPPGEQSVYSPSNYILLGAIIEKLSGVSFGQFVKTNLFAPLGMTSTSCEGRFDDVPGLATAYEPAGVPDGPLNWSRLLVARPYTMSALYSTGACVSSVDDLARFHDALVNGRVVGRQLLADSFEPVRLNNGSPGSMSRGGWQIDKVQGRRAVMRGGALPGVCTWFLMVPDDDLVVILLTNRTPGKPRCGMLAIQIAEIAIGG